MGKRRTRAFFVTTLILTDIVMAGVAFYVAYWLRRWIPLPSAATDLAPSTSYAHVMATHVVSILALLAYSRQYRLERSPSRVDELYGIIGAGTVGTVIGVALGYLIFKNTYLEIDYPRAMVAYAWLLTIGSIMVGRLTHGRLRAALQASGWGRERVLVVGTGEVARMILHKILANPGMGYQIVGAVAADGMDGVTLPVPILGQGDELVVALFKAGAAETIEAPVEVEVLVGGPLVVEGELLGHVADQRLDLVQVAGDV